MFFLGEGTGVGKGQALLPAWHIHKVCLEARVLSDQWVWLSFFHWHAPLCPLQSRVPFSSPSSLGGHTLSRDTVNTRWKGRPSESHMVQVIQPECYEGQSPYTAGARYVICRELSLAQPIPSLMCHVCTIRMPELGDQGAGPIRMLPWLICEGYLEQSIKPSKETPLGFKLGTIRMARKHWDRRDAS